MATSPVRALSCGPTSLAGSPRVNFQVATGWCSLVQDGHDAVVAADRPDPVQDVLEPLPQLDVDLAARRVEHAAPEDDARHLGPAGPLQHAVVPAALDVLAHVHLQVEPGALGEGAVAQRSARRRGALLRPRIRR